MPTAKNDHVPLPAGEGPRRPRVIGGRLIAFAWVWSSDSTSGWLFKRRRCMCVRPHRALNRRTPAQAFAARTKATPRRPGITVPAQHRVRRDRVDSGGNVTLRYQSKLRHLGVGRRYPGTRVMLLVADRDVRVINEDGALLAEFTINPTRDYQPQKRPGQHA